MKLCRHKGQHDRRSKRRQAKDKRRERIIRRDVNIRRNNIGRRRRLTMDDLTQERAETREHVLRMLEGMAEVKDAFAEAFSTGDNRAKD